MAGSAHYCRTFGGGVVVYLTSQGSESAVRPGVLASAKLQACMSASGPLAALGDVHLSCRRD